MLLTERKEEDNISYLNSLLNKHIQQGKEV